MLKNPLINSRVPIRIILEEDRATGIILHVLKFKSIRAIVFELHAQINIQTDHPLPSHAFPGARVIMKVKLTVFYQLGI